MLSDYAEFVGCRGEKKLAKCLTQRLIVISMALLRNVSMIVLRYLTFLSSRIERIFIHKSVKEIYVWPCICLQVGCCKIDITYCKRADQ